MKTTRNLMLVVLMVSMAGIASGTGTRSRFADQTGDGSWPTYSGDYSGRRFSSLTQINQTNVKNLGLAWVSHLTPGMSAAGPFSRPGPGNPPTIVGGEIDEAVPVRGAGRISGAVLQVNGILYVSVPDNAWALDAHDGMVLWHYYWKTKGGTHIGNRGMGITTTGCTSRPRMITWFRSMPKQARSAGTR